MDVEKAKAALDKLDSGNSDTVEAWGEFKEALGMLHRGLPFHPVMHQMQFQGGKSKEDARRFEALLASIGITPTSSPTTNKQKIAPLLESLQTLESSTSSAKTEPLQSEEDKTVAAMVRFRKGLDKASKGLPLNRVLRSLKLVDNYTDEDVEAFSAMLTKIGVNETDAPPQVKAVVKPWLVKIDAYVAKNEQEKEQKDEVAKMVRFRKDLDKIGRGIGVHAVKQQMKVVNGMSDADMDAFDAVLATIGISESDPPLKVKGKVKPWLEKIKAYAQKNPAPPQKTVEKRVDPTVMAYRVLQAGPSENDIEKVIEAFKQLKKPIDDRMLAYMDRMNWTPQQVERLREFIREEDGKDPLLAAAPERLRPFVKAFVVGVRDATKAAAKRQIRSMEVSLLP